MDNYETETGKKEQVTDKEVSENWAFIDAIMETPVIQEMREYLVSEGKVDDDEDQFKQQLYDLWFKLYKRKRQDRWETSRPYIHC